MKNFRGPIMWKKWMLVANLFFVTTNLLACTVDVTISAGDTVSMCSDNIVDLSASNGFVGYAWTGPVTATTQTITPTTGGWYYVGAIDAVNCTSTDSVFVIMNTSPSPIITSSAGLVLCPGAGPSTLSLDQAYASQLWSTSESTPTISVVNGGDYSVTVTDATGCPGSTTITLDQAVFTMGPIGTASVCSGSSVVLEATGGDAYNWSTGEFASTITVAPETLTTYSVTIFKGSCTQTLTQDVDVVSLGDYSLPEVIYVRPGTTEYVAGPAGFTSYLWEPEASVSAPTGTYTGFIGLEDTWVYMTAVGPQCTMRDSVLFILVNLTIPDGFSPNGDMKNDNYVIPELDSLTAKFTVWNRWGDMVFKSNDYQNDWNGTCQSSFCVGGSKLPEGTYFYLLDIEGIEFKGSIELKR